MNVQTLIRQDGRRQLITGGVLVATGLFFLLSILAWQYQSFLLSLLYGPVLTISGLALLKTGFRDYEKAKQTDSGFTKDYMIDTVEKLPGRMYMGHSTKNFFQATLYDMDGKAYTRINEEPSFLHKLTFLAYYGSILSADYTMYNQHGDAVYHIEKKGGFSWRGYVQLPNGHYVAYTKDSKDKATGRRIFHYVEKDYCRWSAEGDPYIGHYKVKDHVGTVWAVIKQNAIPVEAAERFEEINGYLIEWKKRDEIPQSLLAFLFLLQSRQNL
ncbi:hypothetical protein [Halobacillus alkaliphilus]|uniref:hypothetical protein n=1 Tax=Halobacillus alkaliphilus TaxID=396056 RepID=UPI0011139B6E|nr:hypothetical protein [Halobacillus alkaliphilus]